MIFIGTDIVPIARIKKIIQEKGSHFLNHVYTKLEQNICESKNPPSIHYSGKFAAKEAVKKALLSAKSFPNIPVKSIEIQNDNDGTPVVQIVKDGIIYKNLRVSISHAGEYAIAMAILELE
ncbi:MAG: holo-ACP synthase [Candidatus Marinimicrobia bacterium]|nr:holo-ACP synthase [Candidatus Neomarinimicrobiota bacterium]